MWWYLVFDGAQSQGHLGQLHGDLRRQDGVQVQVLGLLLLRHLLHVLTVGDHVAMDNLPTTTSGRG